MAGTDGYRAVLLGEWTRHTKAASHFHVSYQQVYSWVNKYEAGGEEVLQDGRGRTEAPEELTEADRQNSL
ncbi:helix-turn-helix domain-containing protein [Paenibacillus sp.]|uniref:helix-turn-helix domain-containing protein n=1 Tax=Paenibacillus sp. TaxID=58172 RepID=UPI0028B02330|nr:helix-turn-helix domain-containing protein [Paenibacillus sp.]